MYGLWRWCAGPAERFELKAPGEQAAQTNLVKVDDYATLSSWSDAQSVTYS